MAGWVGQTRTVVPEPSTAARTSAFFRHRKVDCGKFPESMVMKAMQSCVATGARDHAGSRRGSDAANEFVSITETRALIASSAALRQQRLDAGDMMTIDQAAELTCTSVVSVNAWIANGRAIGLTQVKRGFRMPSWQFDSPMWEVLPKVFKALGTNEGWAVLSFLETPNGGLDGITPREAIDRGQADRVIELATWGT